MANDAKFVVVCEHCNGTVKGDKEDVIVDCDCGGRYAVTVSRIE